MKTKSEPETEVIMPTVEVSSKIEIGNQELVNIAVARRERELLEEESRLEKLAKDLHKTAESLQGEFNKLCKTTVTDAFMKKAKLLAAAYDIFDMSLTPSVAFRQFNLEQSKLYADVSVTNKDRFASSVSVNMDAPEEVLTLQAKIEENVKASAQCSEDRMNNKREISRLSTVERQARAAVTEAALSGSVKGRQLLASIEKSLPGLPKMISSKD